MTDKTDSSTPRAGLSAAWSTAGPALLLVAVAWAFVPMLHLPSFDPPKLVVLLLGALVLYAGALRRRRPGATDPAALDPLVLVPFALAGLGGALALVWGARGSLAGPLLALGALAVARLVAGAPDGRAALRSIARGAAVASLGAALYALAQVAGLDPAPWGARREPVASFGNVSFAAEFQAAALPLALLLAVLPGSLRADGGSTDRADRVLGVTAAAGAALHLVLAVSRIDLIAAAAGVGAAVVVVLLGTGRRRAATALLCAGGVAALAVATAFAASGSGSEAGSGSALEWLGRSDTVRVRALIWSGVLRMLAEVPLWLPQGVPFEDLYPAFRDVEEYRISFGRTVTTPHNDVLGLLVPLGAAGLLVALACAAALVRRLLRSATTSPATAPPWEAAALIGALAALAVSALASSPLTHPATALLGALCWGASLALAPGQPRRAPAARWIDGSMCALLLVAFLAAFAAFRSDAFVAIGRQAIADGDAASALEALDTAAGADARAFDARYELGTLLLNSGQPGEALAPLRSALEVRPGNMEARASHAAALLATGAAREGEEFLAESLARCPWHPQLLAVRAAHALAEGRPDDAVEDLARAKAAMVHDSRLTALHAEALLAARREGAHEAALAALRRLLEDGDTDQLATSVPAMLRRDPRLLPALAASAKAIAREDPELGATLVAAAVPQARDDAAFLEEAGGILLRAEWTDAGSRLIGRALGLRARAALERGQPETALRLAQKAAPRDPDPEHHLVAARALVRLREVRAAVEAIGAAVAVGRVDPDAIRSDPILGTLLPHPELELLLERAAQRLRDPSGNGTR